MKIFLIYDMFNKKIIDFIFNNTINLSVQPHNFYKVLFVFYFKRFY